MAMLVVVTGNPATGKTTIARRLGSAASLPVVTKDDLKETMADVLGWTDRESSKRLGHAATRVLLRVAEHVLGAGASIVLESNFPPDLAGPDLRAVIERTGADVVQVLVTCPPAIAARRYAERDRHPVHVETDRPELPPMEPMDLPGPVFTVDTADADDEPPDLTEILAAIVNHG
jgi:predicted kinase